MTYDESNDILYIRFIPDAMAYGDEYGGVILMRDFDTDEITGITIMSPKHRRAEREKDLKTVASHVGFCFDLSQYAF